MKRRLLIVFAGLAFLGLATLVALPRVLPRVLSGYRSDIQFAGSTSGKKLFLSIDDAPSNNTSEILRVLKKHQVSATFFIISDRVKSPLQLEEIVAAGHSLGNHLKTTKACSKLSLEEFQSDFDACRATIERTGKWDLFRPASDFGTKDQIAYARGKGYRAVMGTAFPMDHWISDRDWLVRIARWLSVPGAIVILHDGDVRGRTTAEVLDRLIPELKVEGYAFDRLN